MRWPGGQHERLVIAGNSAGDGEADVSLGVDSGVDVARKASVTCPSMRRFAGLLFTGLAVWGWGCGSDDETSPAPSQQQPGDPQAFVDDEVRSLQSCALECGRDCEETTTPFACPALRPWGEIPHDTSEDRCGAWDGATTPAVAPGSCTATEPSGEATAKTDSAGTPVVLPDGRRLVPAGGAWLFNEPDLRGTFPFSAVWVPSTRFVLVSDDGYVDHALRVIDTSKLAAGQDPVASYQAFPYPESLNYGLAVAPDGTIYAASGREESSVLAFSIDPATGVLTRIADKDIPLQNDSPGDAFPMGIDISPDGKHLIVAQVLESSALVYSLDPATYAQREGIFPAGDADQFAASFDPFGKNVAYVSVWNKRRLTEIDLGTQATRKIDVGSQPQEMVFFDANYMAVAEALGDRISIIDRGAAKVVSSTPIDPLGNKHAFSPTALAYDAPNRRLYATLATMNGLAAFDVTPSGGPGSPPTLTWAGAIPTLWWPTDVVVAGADAPEPGSVVILSGKGVGGGPASSPTAAGEGANGDQMHGGIQVVPYPDATQLSSWTAQFEDSQKVGDRSGYPTVSCPAGANDFPVPSSSTQGPSKLIKHVVFIVRENKSYDAIMGDVEGGDGDPSLVMIPGKMDDAFGNIRAIAKTFSHGDNFYHDAEKSIQGHFWAVFGRSSDYTERTWLSTWGRGSRAIPLQGVSVATRPEEGGLFDWLAAGGVEFDNMGEQIGNTGLDTDYGLGGFVSTSSTRPDLLDACYVAARARVLCNLKTFTYAWLVNDHTFGGQAGKPNPGLMIAVNDEATGLLLDGISHSPLWPSTLVVIIEDDPQDGADHVDTHRSIVVMASPWVKRGYVSHGHYDPPALHKLFAHILGLPYNNEMVAHAAVPFDMFTSTPDYTPYTYKPRTWTDRSCNAAGSRSAVEAEAWRWDFSEPDEQPGLSQQLWRMLHNGQQ